MLIVRKRQAAPELTMPSWSVKTGKEVQRSDGEESRAQRMRRFGGRPIAGIVCIFERPGTIGMARQIFKIQK